MTALHQGFHYFKNYSNKFPFHIDLDLFLQICKEAFRGLIRVEFAIMAMLHPAVINGYIFKVVPNQQLLIFSIKFD